jgi:hypothetical protein
MIKLFICSCFIFLGGANLLADEGVPLYRYAYENWNPEPYPLNIYYKGYLTEKEKKVVQYLRDFDKKKVISLSVVNLSNPKDSDTKKVWLWGKEKVKTLPRILLSYPVKSLISANAWSCSLKYYEAKRMMNSPKRKETAMHLQKGCATVWILLECGKEKDDENAALFLQSNLKLLNEKEEFKNHNFVIIRIGRKEKKEKFFINLLRHVKSAAVEDAPVIIPIFGKGRALYALSGDLISAEGLKEICEYLVQPCDKKTDKTIQKPGLDLLFGCDWDKEISIEPENKNGKDDDDESEEDKKIKAFLKKQEQKDDNISLFGSPLFFISVTFLALILAIGIIVKAGKK